MPDKKWSVRGVDEPKKREPPPQKELVPRYSAPPAALPMTQKNAERLLHLLINEHQFDIIKEVVKLYKEADELENFLEKIKIKKSIIKDLLKYCFPVIASEQTEKELPGVKINLNLHAHRNVYKAIEDGAVMDAEYTDGEEK